MGLEKITEDDELLLEEELPTINEDEGEDVKGDSPMKAVKVEEFDLPDPKLEPYQNLSNIQSA